MANSQFYFKWWPFLVGFVFGLFGVAFYLFAVEDRRDKIYSAIAGATISTIITVFMLRAGLVQMPV